MAGAKTEEVGSYRAIPAGSDSKPSAEFVPVFGQDGTKEQELVPGGSAVGLSLAFAAVFLVLVIAAVATSLVLFLCTGDHPDVGLRGAGSPPAAHGSVDAHGPDPPLRGSDLAPLHGAGHYGPLVHWAAAEASKEAVGAPSQAAAAQKPEAAPMPQETAVENKPETPPTEAPDNDGVAVVAKPEVQKFYLYRATGPKNHPLENVNAGDLAGVMWYLHNEVVTGIGPTRKYGIDRIKRYKVRMLPSQEFWNVHHRNFGPFLAFDAARCTSTDGPHGPNLCERIYGQYGYILGCQGVTPGRSAYISQQRTSVPPACAETGCNLPFWYSLPGPCPSKGLPLSKLDFTNPTGWMESEASMAKVPECMNLQPGGLCEHPTGAPDCTYSVEDAGEIILDELTGIGNYTAWREKYHNAAREYDERRDKGQHCSFWDQRHDAGRCQERLERAKKLFADLGATDPDFAEAPVCDFDGWYSADEFDWHPNHTLAVKPQRGFEWK